GELRHDERHQEYHQSDDQQNQQARIHQRQQQLLAYRERQLLISDEAVQHFTQRAALLTCQHRRNVNRREHTLPRKGVRQKRPVLDLFAYRFDVRRELGIGQALGQKIERFQDRQTSADQRHKLLVEDQELLEVDLFAAAASDRYAGDLPPRFDRINQESLLREPVAQLFFRSSFGHLLVDFPARISVFEDKLSHYWLPSPATRLAPGGILKANWASSTGGFSFSSVNRNVSTDWSCP